LLTAATLQSVALASWSIGSTIAASESGSSDVSIDYGGESVRPLTPVDLCAVRASDGALQLAWTRRSRQGFAWVDGIDAPLGESREQYRIILTGGTGFQEYAAEQPAFTVAAPDIVTLGPGDITIEVQQVGDFAASRPARITIT
jgi:hypothetical protein